MTMKKLFIITLGSVIFWSCNNSSDDATINQEVTTHDDHHYNESSDELELNNGEKWIVNEEMKPFVSKQEELLQTYIQTNQTDHQELARNLQEQNQQLIQSCTMTGKSHDELHKWLHPYMALLVDLEKARSKEEA